MNLLEIKLSNAIIKMVVLNGQVIFQCVNFQEYYQQKHQQSVQQLKFQTMSDPRTAKQILKPVLRALMKKEIVKDQLHLNVGQSYRYDDTVNLER